MFNWFWELLYSLAKAILYLIDFIMNFAKMLAGISPVYVDGRETELTYYFLTSNSILNAFKLVSLIGIVLLFIFTAFAVVRSIGKFGAEKTAVRVCLDGAKSLLYFILVPVFMILGAVFVSAVMQSIYAATTFGSASLGGSMFTLFAEEAYTGGDGAVQERIFENFRMGASGYDYYSTSQVQQYFSLKKINYFLAYVGGFCVLSMLVKPLLSFVERIVGIVLLFIIAPLPVSASVLDDGHRFKLWRDEVLNKFLVAYGAIISINVFIMLVEIIYQIDFFPNSSFLNGLARFAFVLGGAQATKMGPVLIGNLVNQGAGSQYAQDMQNAYKPLSALGHMGMGIAGRFARGFGRVASKPVRMGATSVRTRASSAIHRSGSIKRSLKDEAKRSAMMSRIQSENKRKITDAVKSGKDAPSIRGWKGNVMPENNPVVQAITDLGDALLGLGPHGSVAGAGMHDNSENRRSQDALKSAMSGKKTTTSGK